MLSIDRRLAVKMRNRFNRREVRQTLYIVLAALLCFVGPTYFVAVVSRIIPLQFAMIMGFISFIAGVIVVLFLIKE